MGKVGEQLQAAHAGWLLPLGRDGPTDFYSASSVTKFDLLAWCFPCDQLALAGDTEGACK